MMTYHSNLPNELKKVKNWCCYKLVLNKLKNKYDKIPFNPLTGKKARSNDPKTWLDFETCQLASENGDYDGLGFFFSPPFFGIDIDNIDDAINDYINDKKQDTIIHEFLHTLQTYGEYSQSGKGVHFICKGVLPQGRRRKNNVEMYQEGRFFVMTGDTLGEYETVAECTREIAYLHEKYLGKAETIQKYNDIQPHDYDVPEIYDFIQRSKQAEKFNKLYSGDISDYQSHSNADLALCNMLAYWCACDEYKIDTFFRNSGLYREKWDELRGEKTYGEITINKAIEDCIDTFKPNKQDDVYYYIDNMESEHVHTFDDTGNAQRLIARHGGKILFNYTTNKWLVYDGITWNSDTPSAIKLLVDDVVNNMQKEFGWIKDFDQEVKEKKFKELTKHIHNSRSRKSKENLLHEAKHYRGKTAKDFDTDPMLFNVQNGYLNLKTGELKNHNREKLFTLVSNVEYTDTQSCDLWLKFLNEIFENNQELIEFIQIALGYSLSGLNVEHCMFILNGDGLNGKSVFMNTLKDVFGTYCKTVQADTLMSGTRLTGPNPEIMRLMNTRLAIASETEENATLNEPLIKQLTGGDRITARGLHQEPIEFSPHFKLWMATNHKPIITGTDRGIWRRIHLINFNYEVQKVDKLLEFKLKKELSGILNWIFEGFLKYQRFGLVIPDCVKVNTHEYKKEMDVISLFIDECVEYTQGREVKATIVYNEYKEWCKLNGYREYTSNKFGREFPKRFKKIRTNQGNFYVDLKLKNYKF